jgi:hypothetical protein
VRDRGGGQPVTVVAHVRGQPRAALVVGLEASRHGDRESAMTQGIADEVGKNDVEAAAVQRCGQPGRHVSGYVRAPTTSAGGTGPQAVGQDAAIIVAMARTGPDGPTGQYISRRTRSVPWCPLQARRLPR